MNHKTRIAKLPKTGEDVSMMKTSEGEIAD